MRGTKVAATESQWLLSKSPECSAPKTKMIPSRLMCTLFLYLPTLCINITLVTSLNDVTIICFPLLVGKNTVHVQESHAGSSAHLLAFPLTNFSVSYSYAQTSSSILYPKFKACDIYSAKVSLCFFIIYAFLFICVIKFQCVSPYQQGFSHETL